MSRLYGTEPVAGPSRNFVPDGLSAYEPRRMVAVDEFTTDWVGGFVINGNRYGYGFYAPNVSNASVNDITIDLGGFFTAARICMAIDDSVNCGFPVQFDIILDGTTLHSVTSDTFTNGMDCTTAAALDFSAGGDLVLRTSTPTATGACNNGIWLDDTTKGNLCVG